jgi:hypothetical protein
MRALTSLIVEAEFCCQFGQFVSLLARELKISNSAIKQDCVTRDIDISVDTPSQRREIWSIDIGFGDPVASQHPARQSMPERRSGHRTASAGERIRNGHQQAAGGARIEQRAMRTIEDNPVFSARNGQFAAGGAQSI